LGHRLRRAKIIRRIGKKSGEPERLTWRRQSKEDLFAAWSDSTVFDSSMDEEKESLCGLIRTTHNDLGLELLKASLGDDLLDLGFAQPVEERDIEF
jgi:hypothetical protein